MSEVSDLRVTLNHIRDGRGEVQRQSRDGVTTVSSTTGDSPGLSQVTCILLLTFKGHSCDF